MRKAAFSGWYFILNYNLLGKLKGFVLRRFQGKTVTNSSSGISKDLYSTALTLSICERTFSLAPS